MDSGAAWRVGEIVLDNGKAVGRYPGRVLPCP